VAPKAPASKDPFGFSLDMDGGAAPPAAARQAPAPAASFDFGDEAPPMRASPPAPATPPAPPASVTAAVATAIQGLPAEVSAATREMIEKVVWEVVPELAEIIIREELKRLLKDRGLG